MSYTPKRQNARKGWNRELHGSRARYRKGCSCTRCLAAERRYRQDYRLRQLVAPQEADAGKQLRLADALGTFKVRVPRR